MKQLALVLFVEILFNQHVPTVHVEAAVDGFIRTRGVHFLLEGNPYYANGFNAYWLMYVASDPSQRPKVSAAFHDATTHGLTVARTWAFSDGGYRPLQYAPGSYNEQMFKGLDFVIAEARKYRIKHIPSLANNYDSFGGKKQYVNWARSQGQYLTSDDDFFTILLVKGYYKNHVTTVLNRYNSFTGIHYKVDETIMAWELMNEPRLSSTNDEYQLLFLNNCLDAHIHDAQSVLRKPILFTEFGKSCKDTGFNTYKRDQLFNFVYNRMYSSAKRGGPAGGACFGNY
ncbi:Mannan endo-1,4-beta-mannosidase 7 [Hibiscus syriacus]|uniref:mannan endo-1,4-beta-mannosidase n=1 Tax=Hibiscus syriacus TaxID=106335 RepID=A0A6A3BLH5_HIBSY|nr:Mannan endo-1,4-beta-mannosidase 7 [Hibiscus syriacus]